MVAGLNPNCQPKIKGENDARSGSGRSQRRVIAEAVPLTCLPVELRPASLPRPPHRFRGNVNITVLLCGLTVQVKPGTRRQSAAFSKGSEPQLREAPPSPQTSGLS